MAESEMVERVARAMSIADKESDMWDVMSEDGDGYGYVGKNEYRAMARAAIEAMREPTGAMIDAVHAQADPGFPDEGGDPTSADNVWRQMIDGALK